MYQSLGMPNTLSIGGKDLQRRAEAGLIDVGEEMSLRAAIRLLCGRRTVSSGRNDSAARIGTGVRHAKTLVHTHRLLRSAQTQRKGYATVPHHS